MISVQVGGLKAFLTERNMPCVARHYYVQTGDFFSPEEIDLIHTHFLGDHLYAMLEFPDYADQIGRRIEEKAGGQINAADCACRLEVFTRAVVADCLQVGPSLIGFTTTHMQYMASIYTSARIKEALPSASIVLGGIALYGRSAEETLALFPQIDFVIVGEGEAALWRLAEHRSGRRAAEDVPQLVRRAGTQIVTSAAIETIASVDDLPIPDYSDYFETLSRAGRRLTPRATVEMTRGCRWGKCSFCIEGLPSRGGYRSKSPQRVAAEIREYVDRYRILDYVTSDPDVAFNEKAFAEVATLGFDLNFMVEISGLVRVPHFERMLAAGIRTVQIGIESFSSDLLSRFNKGVTLAKYVELLRMCAEGGVRLVYNNIHGAPFETQAHVDEAIENMERLMFFQPPRLSHFRVSVGSDVMANLAAYGIAGLLPAEEVDGYPTQVAERIGMLVSFNAGYGFERAESAEPVDYSRYLSTLQTWRTVSEAGGSRTARRGAGFIRVDHVVGNERYHIDIIDPLEIALIVYCRGLRRIREVRAHFDDYSPEEIDHAIDKLWSKHLLFRTDKECVSLVTVKESV
ncbi:MAG TPA: radical SAM protein [Allosphingosinicella sp.]